MRPPVASSSSHVRRHRVVVTQRFFDAAARAYLHTQGCDTVMAEPPPERGDGDFSESELVDRLHDADGWIVGHAHVTDALLRALPALRVIARRGVGYERVDTEAVRHHGKVATIAVGGNDASVADHAVALMLAVAHRLRQCQLQMGGGDWSIPVGSDLYRATVGVVGLGRIGRGVVQRLQGFDARVLALDRPSDSGFAQAQGIACVDKQRLLAESDFLTLHVPLTDETRFFIQADALARMKPSAVLVNTARGGLVEDGHLLAALQAGRLAGAGLDVFLSEFDPSYRAISEALLRLPHVVATPHSGASTRESLQRTNLIAARSVVAVLHGGSPAKECVVADGRAAAG